MSNHLDWIDVDVECESIEKIRPICRGRSGIKIKLKEVDVANIIGVLCETFGANKVIDYIRENGNE